MKRIIDLVHLNAAFKDELSEKRPPISSVRTLVNPARILRLLKVSAETSDHLHWRFTSPAEQQSARISERLLAFQEPFKTERFRIFAFKLCIFEFHFLGVLITLGAFFSIRLGSTNPDLADWIGRFNSGIESSLQASQFRSPLKSSLSLHIMAGLLNLHRLQWPGLSQRKLIEVVHRGMLYVVLRCRNFAFARRLFDYRLGRNWEQTKSWLRIG